ncbi:MAG TPA: hypothetical protein VL197_08145 [Nitrospirota bacterium]|nr:hypothetical protein [Nitrospirota bacterium]
MITDRGNHSGQSARQFHQARGDREKTQLPTFFLFLGIPGGLQAYGILGILFGPLIVTLVITSAQIYREEFAGKE